MAENNGLSGLWHFSLDISNQFRAYNQFGKNTHYYFWKNELVVNAVVYSGKLNLEGNCGAYVHVRGIVCLPWMPDWGLVGLYCGWR